MHPLTHRHTARIRGAGTNVDLFVDISGTPSKNARRQQARYAVQHKANRDHLRPNCEAAVKAFWEKHPR